jgi:hypothetical protein
VYEFKKKFEFDEIDAMYLLKLEYNGLCDLNISLIYINNSYEKPLNKYLKLIIYF